MFEKYRKGDVFLVDVQPQQLDEAAEFAAFFDVYGQYSLRDGKEVLAVFAYFIEEDEKTAECFALVGKDAGRKMTEMVRAVKRVISQKMRHHNTEVLTMSVKSGFDNGVRMAKMLGFSYVGEMKEFFLKSDYQLFERRENVVRFDDGN